MRSRLRFRLFLPRKKSASIAFWYPKLNIREQMAAYKEIIDRSSLEGERLHPRKEHDDR